MKHTIVAHKVLDVQLVRLTEFSSVLRFYDVHVAICWKRHLTEGLWWERGIRERNGRLF